MNEVSKQNNNVIEYLHANLPSMIADAMEEALGQQTLNTSEVASQYSITRQQQYNLRKDNKITFIQDGRKVLYRRKDVEQYLNEHTIQGDK